MDVLPRSIMPVPLMGDGVSTWFEPRAATALTNADITTLASPAAGSTKTRVVGGYHYLLTSARRIEAFFAKHPSLLQQVSALVRKEQRIPLFLGSVCPCQKWSMAPWHVQGPQGHMYPARQQ